jgi:hypothetical protein
MNCATFQAVSRQISDLQGSCRLIVNSFVEQDEMRQVLGAICENLNQILVGLGELCEVRNGPPNQIGSNRLLNLIQ